MSESNSYRDEVIEVGARALGWFVNTAKKGDRVLAGQIHEFANHPQIAKEQETPITKEQLLNNQIMNLLRQICGRYWEANQSDGEFTDVFMGHVDFASQIMVAADYVISRIKTSGRMEAATTSKRVKDAIRGLNQDGVEEFADIISRVKRHAPAIKDYL